MTAGSTSGVHRGFAIPVKQALQIVRRIESGKPSATVHIGPTAFLGVVLKDVSGGAQISTILPGKPADAAGLVVGDVITSLNSVTISVDCRRPPDRALARPRKDRSDRVEGHGRRRPDGHHHAHQRPAAVASSAMSTTRAARLTWGSPTPCTSRPRCNRRSPCRMKAPIRATPTIRTASAGRTAKPTSERLAARSIWRPGCL